MLVYVIKGVKHALLSIIQVNHRRRCSFISNRTDADQITRRARGWNTETLKIEHNVVRALAKEMLIDREKMLVLPFSKPRVERL